MLRELLEYHSETECPLSCGPLNAQEFPHLWLSLRFCFPSRGNGLLTSVGTIPYYLSLSVSDSVAIRHLTKARRLFLEMVLMYDIRTDTRTLYVSNVMHVPRP